MTMSARSTVVPGTAVTASSLDPVWWLGEIGRRQPVLAGAGVLVAIAIAPMALAGGIDGRLFNGIDVWIKPIKFAVAVTIYMFTLAFFAGWVGDTDRSSRWFRTSAWVAATAGVLEIFYISFQASLAEASHYNRTDMLHIALYGMMGLGATLMIAFSAMTGVSIARNRDVDIAPALRDSAVLGLLLSFVLTVIVAFTLSAWGSHWIGGVHSDAGGMRLTGWSRDGGDLRVAHLFATHAMHFIPAFAVLSATLFGGDKRLPVWLFSFAYTGFVLFLFFQALAAQPFLPLIQ